jgi:hypothetical protein
VLDEIGDYSFFHMPEFHKLAEMRDEGQAVMAVYREDDFVAGFPMLLRDIEVSGEPTGLRDATSVAGFAGIVASDPEPGQETIRRFQQSLLDFYRELGIVTAFSRLNPVATTPRLLDGLGLTLKRGMSLVIDLTAPLDVQLARYKSERRKKLRRLLETSMTIEQVGVECLDDFMRLFSETMERNDADSPYRFDRSYVEYLMTEMSDVMHLFICRLDGEIISVALSGCTRGLIEGYLGGTAFEHRQLSPSTLLYDRIRIWGATTGSRVLHVGGGVDGQRDTIYTYKLSFGAEEIPYFTWRCIADHSAYDRLCKQACGCPGDLDENFFPKYRDPELRRLEKAGV